MKNSGFYRLDCEVCNNFFWLNQYDKEWPIDPDHFTCADCTRCTGVLPAYVHVVCLHCGCVFFCASARVPDERLCVGCSIKAHPVKKLWARFVWWLGELLP